MPRGMHKSRTFRRVKVRTPGAKTVTQYRRRKPSKAHCGSCRATLAGVPQGIPNQIKKLPKTARRLERPYGGVMCSKCTRQLIKEEVRANV